ncbi:hypothetical protein DY218_04315 [Streptomyces triticagri]|uniref:Secreted protein n=1 Tax=Streptomyces triticagri TaxID=2293568 RepID=A0A372MAC8_9ACTN|nr:DUF5719 family protein [Streptomyces triticagri]RFU87904.1 hypothetical protein DY218_04315 [Streptomyces triticagri]
MNRTTLSLIAAGTGLVAVTGFAALTSPDSQGTETASAAARKPVERSSVLCPAPSSSDLAETAYTSFTPKSAAGSSSAAKGSAELAPAQRKLKDEADGKDKKKDKDKDNKTDKPDKADKKGKGKPFLAPEEPGKAVTADASGADAPALIGSADGSLAPGWTVQQTTKVPAGSGRGLLGMACSTPDTDFWFPGASTAKERSDYVHVTNPDSTAAVVDIELYGREGAIKSELGEGIQVPPESSVPVLLSTLTDEPQTNVTAHVTARTGRVGAAVQARDDELGADWLPPSADPGGSVVLPGIPKDATSVRLLAFAPGEDDADLKVSLAGRTGSITPAGNETLHVKSGMTAAVDLGDLTKGEAGSLVLTPTEDSTPVVAALRVTRGKGADQEMAFIPAAAPVGERATAADNRAKGSTLALTAPRGTAKVRVTASAGSEGGRPVTKTYTVRKGTTQAVEPPVPSGLKGTYALTVEQVSGTAYAARTLAENEDGVPMFTVQTLPDDRGTVSVPEAAQDLAVLQD